MWLDSVLAERRDSPAPLIEVLAPTGEPAEVWTDRQVFSAALALAERLRSNGSSAPRVGLVANNTPGWIVADLACLIAGAVEVPVPLAFSAEQAAALLREVDLCLVDDAGRGRLGAWGAGNVLPPGTPVQAVDVAALAEVGAGLRPAPSPPHDRVCKVIHTSGTTSAPKGVRIRVDGLGALLLSLRDHIPAGASRRYLSLVPLSLLIEQVTACYLTLLTGGTIVLLPTGATLLGTSPDALVAMLRLMHAARPTAMQGPPALYEAFAAIAAAHPDDDPPTLAYRLFGRTEPAFLACGGAPVASEVLALLWARGIPVYEGYGLSENSSVVSWNTPADWRLGSVGRPLAHVETRLAADGELLVRSDSLFAGYTVDDPSSCHVDEDGWLHTGDLAEFDDDGFLYIKGRKKNIIITATGRNVAPDWVASRYQALPEVASAVVFGDRLDTLVGFFVVAPGYRHEQARQAIEEFGAAQLSEVERVGRIHLRSVDDPEIVGLFTVTGRPVRQKIWDLVSAELITSSGKDHP
jgi:long-chain acyl-CoA synthetase